jgi:hypothetical protein
MFRAATSGRQADRYATRFSTETPSVPVEKLTIAPSPPSSTIRRASAAYSAGV